MGMYCCCGERKENECNCEWDGWFLCRAVEQYPDVTVKLPDCDGIYEVRVCDEDNYEDNSQFCTIPKHWGEKTNREISHWELDYCDGYTGYRNVYAWKGISLRDKA